MTGTSRYMITSILRTSASYNFRTKEHSIRRKKIDVIVDTTDAKGSRDRDVLVKGSCVKFTDASIKI